MRRIISILVFCSLLIIASFLLFGDFESIVNSQLSSQKSLLAYSAFSFLILTSDIVLPIPSSVVMILNGKVLGVFLGTIISLLAGLSSSSIGFYLGRKTSWIADKVFSKKERETSSTLFKKFGNSAIVISKALPVLSEAVAFLSGTTSISFSRFLVLSVAGHLMVSLTYAIAGQLSGNTNSNLIGGIVICSVLVAGWIIQFFIKKKTAGNNALLHTD